MSYDYVISTIVLLWKFSSIFLFCIMCFTMIWYFLIRITLFFPLKTTLNSSKNPTHRKSIYLIHGTWGNVLSNWYKKNSKFGKSFHVNNSDIYSFPWAGNNSFYVRKVVSIRLKEELYNNLKTHDHITLIGHSHGGSIALDARSLLDKKSQKKIKIICISTPILIKMNNIRIIKKFIGVFVTSTMLLWASMLILFTLLHNKNISIDVSQSIPHILSRIYLIMELNNWPLIAQINEFGKGLAGLYPYLIFISLTIILGGILWVIRRSILKSFHTNSFNEMNSTINKDLCTTFIRTPGDEVSGIFYASYLMTRAISAFVNLPIIIKNILVNLISDKEKKLIILLLSAIFIFFVYFYEPDSPIFIIVTPIITIIIIVYFNLWLLPLIILTVMMYPILISLNSLINLFAGPESAMLGTWQLYSAEPAPIGNWEIVTFKTEKKENNPPFNHTAFANEPEIIDWLINNV